MRYPRLLDTPPALVAASHLACIATLAVLLLLQPAGHARVTSGAMLVCLATIGIAANAVRRQLTGIRRLTFLALAAIAGAGAVLELQHLVGLLPTASAVHLGSPLELAVLIGALNALLGTYGAHVAAERTVQLDEAQRVLRRMWLLGQQITLELDPRRVLERFLEAVVDIAQADAGALGMVASGGDLEIVHTIGAHGSVTGLSGPVVSEAMTQVIRARTPWWSYDVHAEGTALTSHALLAREGIRSLAMIPLTRLGESLGVVVIGARTPARFDRSHVERIEALADLLTVALTNAELVESLRQAEWRFRTLFRAAPDAVMTILDSGRVREANDAVRDVIGLEPAHVVGRLIGDLVMPEDRARLAEVLHDAAHGKPGRLEAGLAPFAGGEGLPGVRKSTATRRTVAFAASRLPEADPPCILLVGRDMTADREMRARLMESDRLAAVGELVAGVAHEVNNPLSSISAYAQLMLRDASLDDSQRESLDVIRSETHRASQVVKDLLAFARRSEPFREPLDVNAVVTRSLRLRQYQLTAQGVDVAVDLADALPAVIGDARQLQQVCLNLLTNAIQAIAAAGGGSLRITTRFEAGHVLVEVADTGLGIPADIRARIFEPFFTTKGEGEGTGLGLSVSYGIVSAHGGAITLAETSSAGSTFRVALPAADTTTAAVVPGREPGAFRLRSPLAGVRLLFVDDEPTLRASMEAFAEIRGFTVVTAADGNAALAVIEATSVDAVVCDLRMPGVDGVAFHERLRVIRPGLAARTVFITGDVVTTGTRGVIRQPIINKPFGFEQLEDVLVAVMRGTPVPGGGAGANPGVPRGASKRAG